MSMPFLGEIRLFAGSYAPAGWGICDGSLLAIAEYDALFYLIGTRYGGDGQNTFALPNLQVPVGAATPGAVGRKGEAHVTPPPHTEHLRYIMAKHGLYPQK